MDIKRWMDGFQQIGNTLNDLDSINNFMGGIDISDTDAFIGTNDSQGSGYGVMSCDRGDEIIHRCFPHGHYTSCRSNGRIGYVTIVIEAIFFRRGG